VNKCLTIRSNNGYEVTIVVNSFHGHEPVFRITANQVNISGFTVKGLDEFTFGTGIQIRNANYCNISNNILISNERGISLESSSHNGFGTILLNRRLHHFAIPLCEFHHTNMVFSRILL